MKIAIHKSKGYSNHWIKYCEENHIDYKIVNCYENSIITDINDCDALMWHFHHANPIDNLFAKQLLYAVESSGKKVFPDFNTVWHFDDKVGQKYLLESIEAPLVPSYVFYSKDEAFKWIEKCKLPVVSKLRCGASSENVKLIKTTKKGKRIISKAFDRGIKIFSGWYYFKESLKKYSEGFDDFTRVLKGLARIIISPDAVKRLPIQKGYVYFQDFIPDNAFDLRLIVIGDKAYGMKRLVRKNDFRASGSAKFVYDTIDKETLKIAFEISQKLKLQSVAFDFIFLKNRQPLITEISCFFGTKGSSMCTGYWDKDLNFHEGNFNPFGWMIETVLNHNLPVFT